MVQYGRMKERKPRKGEQTRQRIISEAAGLFNRRGYHGGSLQDLMKATGLGKGGIYRHFSSKEELAALAFEHAWREAFAARQTDLDVIPNSVDKIKQLVTNFVERRPVIPGGCPLLNTAVDADDGNPLLRDHARKALKAWQDRIESMIAEGIRSGEIRRGADTRRVANLIIASLEGALMIARLERSDQALRDAAAHLHGYIETELRNQKRK
jgi:TetR/AcrR family transcriptional regulator, transcriptional repressor for nem operon